MLSEMEVIHLAKWGYLSQFCWYVLFLDHSHERWKCAKGRDFEGHSDQRCWALWTLENTDESARSGIGKGNCSSFRRVQRSVQKSQKYIINYQKNCKEVFTFNIW